VWQVQLSPLRIVEACVLRTGDIAKAKAPVLIERNCLLRTRIGKAGHMSKNSDGKE
jgi:hypothetical protein